MRLHMTSISLPRQQNQTRNCSSSSMLLNSATIKQFFINMARLTVAFCFLFCLYFLIVCVLTHNNHNYHDDSHHRLQSSKSGMVQLQNFKYEQRDPEMLVQKESDRQLKETQANIRQAKSIKFSRFFQTHHHPRSNEENNEDLSGATATTRQRYSVIDRDRQSSKVNSDDYSDCGYHMAFTLIERDKLTSTKLMNKFSNTLKSILININSTGLDPGSLCIHLITDNMIRLHLLYTINNVHEELTRQLTNQPYTWLHNHLPFEEHRPLTRYFFIDSATVESRLEYLLPTLRTFFTHKPNSYYSNALFFYSMILHQVIPSTIADRLILLDVDVQLNANILQLFEEFGRFKPEEVIGIAYEQQPVYRHILHEYRRGIENETTAGSPPPNGFPGFNSGVVLLHLRKMRESKLYNSLLNQDVITHLCQKYRFRGHLGDQDFYTLAAIDHRSLFHVLPCGWNRQLCQWWRFHGYGKVFDDYHRCDAIVMLYHGNCNSALPTLTYYGAYRRRR